MSRPSGDALDVLRQVWSADGGTAADLDEVDAAGIGGTGKECKRMTDVGFGGFAGADEDLRTAWRGRLEREGKLGATSLADLILGPEAAR